MFEAVNRTVKQNQPARYNTLVRSEFRKGYKVPLLDYQESGIITRALWPNKNHILRIVPGYDPSTGEVFRQNINCSEYSLDASLDSYLSDTFSKASVTTRFGQYKDPLLTAYKPGSPDEQAFGGDTVMHTFIRNIMNAVQNAGKPSKGRIVCTEEWKTWCGIGPSACLAYDKVSLLMQALLFKYNDHVIQKEGQDLRDEDGDILPMLAVVVIDNKVSIGNICQALVEPANMSEPLDALTNNKYGGFAELDGIKLYLNTTTDPTTGRAVLRPSVQEASKGWVATPYPLSEEVIKQLWHPWDEILNYMNAQEQLHLCAQEFGADTVNYVLGSDPRMHNLQIPDSIKNVGLGKYAYLGTPGGSVTLSSNNFSTSTTAARPSMLGGTAKGLQGAMKAAPAFKPIAPTPAPESAEEPSGVLHSVAPNATLDIDKLQATVKGIRKAAGIKAKHTEEDQAAQAGELLDGIDTPDFPLGN